MDSHELHLELLLGRCVYDATGDRVGRIQEVRAEQQGGEWVISEYEIGIAGAVERFSAWGIGIKLLRLFGAKHRVEGYSIPWDKIDLSEPDRPRLTCTVEELKEMLQQLEAEQS